jgi:queuine tRNA-ribosyltransferase
MADLPLPGTFELHTNDGKARAGTLHTAHGPIQTPIFMPVGTVASVKGLHPHEVREEVKAQIILANTYHLYLRPGVEVVETAGGIQEFGKWRGPMLTDSGGYQVYSLAQNRKLSEEGATFRSHIDGSKHLFTPESVMGLQRKIGADIIMAFDECPPYPSTYAYAKTSMGLTHRWLDRCISSFSESECPHGYEQMLFPILQGSTFPDLRKQSAEFVASKDLPGNAIGGLSVGEPAHEMYPVVEQVCEILPKEKPRYLMGVGTPANIIECIARGIDMFDCVLPSRNARHGLIYTREGSISIKSAKWANDHSPIDDGGPCATSQLHSKAYLRHLFHAKEALGGQLATIHNLSFYLWLVGQAREHILAGTFTSWSKDILPKLDRRL